MSVILGKHGTWLGVGWETMGFVMILGNISKILALNSLILKKFGIFWESAECAVWWHIWLSLQFFYLYVVLSRDCTQDFALSLGWVGRLSPHFPIDFHEIPVHTCSHDADGIKGR